MHLMTHDKVRVGIVTGSPDILCHTERVAGFVNSLKRYKSDMEIVDVVENHDDEFESYEKTTRLLTEHPELNALFFAAGGVNGGCRSLSVLGREGQVRVIAFDKVPTTKALVKKALSPPPSASSPGSRGQAPDPAVRLSDHRRDAGERIQLCGGGYQNPGKHLN